MTSSFVKFVFAD